MQRQKSILSFLKKPSPDDQKTGGDTLTGRRTPHFPPNKNSQNGAVPNQSAMDSSTDVRGMDTPPEKVPRQIFPANLTASDGGFNSGPSLFSSIMHKFVKLDDRENSSDRSEANGNPITVCSTSNKSDSTKRLPTQTEASGLCRKDFALNTNKQTVAQGDKGHSLLVESDDAILGPETSAMRPLVPRLKRV